MQLAKLLWLSTLSLPSNVVRWWRKDYQDSRIIFEQNGDLQYFAISAKTQRVLVRGSIITFTFLSTALIVLLISTISLQISRARLEKSHQDVFKALVSGTADSETGESIKMSEDQMVALAQSIRDRDMSIRRYVDTSTAAASQENVSLKSQLDSSGLTEKNCQNYSAKQSQGRIQLNG